LATELSDLSPETAGLLARAVHDRAFLHRDSLGNWDSRPLPHSADLNSAALLDLADRNRFSTIAQLEALASRSGFLHLDLEQSTADRFVVRRGHHEDIPPLQRLQNIASIERPAGKLGAFLTRIAAVPGAAEHIDILVDADTPHRWLIVIPRLEGGFMVSEFNEATDTARTVIYYSEDPAFPSRRQVIRYHEVNPHRMLRDILNIPE